MGPPYPTTGTATRLSRAAAGRARRRRWGAGQDEEEAAAHREDVLLQGLALEAGLDGQEPPGQALLVADEGQALVEPPGGVEAAGEVEAAAQDAAAGGLGGARVGHADVGVQGDAAAGRVLGVAGVVALAVLAQRGPAGLVAADDLLLLVQGGAVPELDEHADDADGLVAAAHRPGGLAVVGPDPDQLVHQLPVGDVEVGRAVLEAEQVAVVGPAGHRPGVGPVVAVEHPAQDQVVPGPAHQLAQGVQQRVGLVGREGQQQVAVALGRVEAVVGQERHPDQLPGSALGQAEAVVEQRRPHAEGHGQPVGAQLGPEDAGLGGRVGGVAAQRRAGLHQPAGLVGEVAQGPGQPGPVVGDQVERGQQAEVGRRGVDARLALAQERHPPARPGPRHPVGGAAGQGGRAQGGRGEGGRPQEGAPAQPGRLLLGGSVAAHAPVSP
jgi:hypothetical protein